SIAAAEALVGDKLEGDAVVEAMVGLTLPGRLEPVATGPLVMLDGAHNADGIASLVAALEDEFPTTLWHVVFGVMGDKNVDLMIECLAPIAKGFVATAPDSERAVKPYELAEKLATQVGVPVLTADTTDLAVDMARAEAGPAGSVLVTGSLYLVGEARSAITAGDQP
ncbi:MAG: dihydrofolate synthase, partial [Acidimicrobiia bacterium]|nr:dihydrofolate synthase [Acidimicrobiia bacterium]